MSEREKVNILLVDDQPAKLLSLQAILSDLNENVLEANDADEALKLLLAHDIAVVLVDVCMPKMDGFELAQLIRGHPRYRRTAIIFISAVHLTDADRLRGYELGAVDYIPVPIIPAVLRAKVSVFAELYRTTNELHRLNAALESRADEARSMLAAIVESSQDAIISKTLEGIITSWNAGATALFGYTPAEAVGQPIALIQPPELRAYERVLVERLGRGERIEPFEAKRMTKHGRQIDVSLTISPVRDAHGRIIGASKVIRDISARKAAEAVLARDRETLERLVADRTEQLRASNERLRLADRMATIGTLSAGLGHDMGNLLLPIRMRLDAIEAGELPASAREDIAAIRKASEYLQRLAGSLRLLALDPQGESPQRSATYLTTWWREAEGMVHNAIPRSVSLTAHIAEGLPPVRIGRAGLTQIVFNLAQNAGDALASTGRSDGSITLSAALNHAGDRVQLHVSDNGPGMSDEARRRCLEPFFTTKTRGLSTGLGLTLVSGLVKSAGGAVHITTELGRGTTFRLELPIAATPPAPAEGAPARPLRGRANVSVRDARLLAHVKSALRSLDFDVRHAADGHHAQADLWVTDTGDNGGLEAARAFTRAGDTCRALVFGAPPGTQSTGAGGERVICLDAQTQPSLLRSRIREVLGRGEGPGEAAP